MTKIVYNACYGGFSLSEEAVKLARELSGNPKWGGATLTGEFYHDGSGPAKTYGSVYLYGVDRTDKLLIKVIETLGDKANGSCAKLKIAEIEGKFYRIDEDDGFESVETPDNQNWNELP